MKISQILALTRMIAGVECNMYSRTFPMHWHEAWIH